LCDVECRESDPTSTLSSNFSHLPQPGVISSIVLWQNPLTGARDRPNSHSQKSPTQISLHANSSHKSGVEEGETNPLTHKAVANNHHDVYTRCSAHLLFFFFHLSTVSGKNRDPKFEPA
jgi:hypothetical protein